MPPHENGGSRITLTDDETATVTMDEDGSVVIDIASKPAEGELEVEIRSGRNSKRVACRLAPV
jgi:hypothetical protein